MPRLLLMALLAAAPLAPTDAQPSDRLGEDSRPTDARFFPSSSILFAELTDPAALVSLIFDHPLRQKIESLEPYKMAVRSPPYQRFIAGRTMVETQLQMSWREALEALLAHRVSVAFDADSRGAALVIHGKDAASMKLFHNTLLEMARLGDNANIRQGTYRGIDAYRIDAVRYAVVDDRIVVTSSTELGQQVLDRLLDGAGPSLEDNPRFQTALRSRQPDLAGWGFADVESIRDANMAAAVFQNQINNPVAELLVGGIQSTLAETPYATVSLRADSGGVGLQLGMPFAAQWIPEHREYYFGPSGRGRGPVLPVVDQTLLTLSTYRDFSQLWLRAGDLFNQQVNDGLAKADANLTTLFAGRDFGEEILGSFRSEVGLIVTRNDLSNTLPRPTIKLPAFALVLEMKEPESMTRELRRIFQSLVGFLNIVGAMNGQNQLELDMEKLGDQAELVTSRYVPEEDDRESVDAPIAFNFSPTVGFAGKRFVIASSRSLASQLSTSAEPDPPRIDDNTKVQLDAGVLRAVLADNREQLVAQNMLDDGHSRQEAEAIIDLMLQVVGYFQDASIRLHTTPDQLQADLDLHLQP